MHCSFELLSILWYWHMMASEGIERRFGLLVIIRSVKNLSGGHLCMGGGSQMGLRSRMDLRSRMGLTWESVSCVTVVATTACPRKLDECVGKRDMGGSPSWDAKSGSFVAKLLCWQRHAWKAHSIGLGYLSPCVAWLVTAWSDFAWSAMAGWSVTADWLDNRLLLDKLSKLSWWNSLWIWSSIQPWNPRTHFQIPYMLEKLKHLRASDLSKNGLKRTILRQLCESFQLHFLDLSKIFS